MGMYDNVIYECVCPACGGKVHNFQSKDNVCNLENLTTEDVDNFYANCSKCHAWVEFERVIDSKVNNEFERTIGSKEWGEVNKKYTKIITIREI